MLVRPAAAEGSSEIRKQRNPSRDAFRPDPQYDASYNAQGQVDIYGAKSVVEPPRPPVEIGRQQYTSGIFDESSTVLGQLNPLLPGLAIYGDWRTAIAFNGNNGKEIAQVATRLNIDVDLKLTGTERIHAFFTPLQEDNVKFTRFEFDKGDGDGEFTNEFDPDPQLFFSKVTSARSIPDSPARKPVSTSLLQRVFTRCFCKMGSGRTTRSSVAR